MPPKKKGNKKAQDDWEADLGESITPQDAAAEPVAEEPAAEEESVGGGLMAAIQRRGKKKGKKAADQDWVEGEDPTADDGASGGLAAKAPEEANFDEDDVFAGNYKPKKNKAEEKEEASKPVDDAPRVKTKAEKEKEKKEKEKQRKKEMACFIYPPYVGDGLIDCLGCKEESQCSREERSCCSRRVQGRRALCSHARACGRSGRCRRQEKESSSRSCCAAEAAGRAQAT